MANRFVQAELIAGDSESSILVVNRTELSALRAGLLGVEGLGLLLQECGDGALCQSRRRCGSDLFHGVEVHRFVGAGPRESLLGDSFAPLSGQITNCLKFLCLELVLRHG